MLITLLLLYAEYWFWNPKHTPFSLCIKEYVKTFLSNSISFILNDDSTNFLFFVSDEIFGTITVNYRYDYSSQTFIADPKSDKNAMCKSTYCEEELKNLPECSRKNVSLSDGSCAPNKTINLDVPPGECQFFSICVFRTTGWVHVCVLVLLANVARKKDLQ